MRSLKRRLDRLADQVGSAGRMITLDIAREHVGDSALIDATLTAAGIEREDGDLVVLLKSYATLGTEPPCALRSSPPLTPKGPESAAMTRGMNRSP